MSPEARLHLIFPDYKPTQIRTDKLLYAQPQSPGFILTVAMILTILLTIGKLLTHLPLLLDCAPLEVGNLFVQASPVPGTPSAWHRTYLTVGTQ